MSTKSQLRKNLEKSKRSIKAQNSYHSSNSFNLVAQGKISWQVGRPVVKREVNKNARSPWQDSAPPGVKNAPDDGPRFKEEGKEDMDVAWVDVGFPHPWKFPFLPLRKMVTCLIKTGSAWLLVLWNPKRVRLLRLTLGRIRYLWATLQNEELNLMSVNYRLCFAISMLPRLPALKSFGRIART